jgi:hypothetical protein
LNTDVERLRSKTKDSGNAERKEMVREVKRKEKRRKNEKPKSAHQTDS